MSQYLKISPKIEELVIDNPRTAGSVSWININSAGKTEITYLLKHQHFNLHHLKQSLSRNIAQRAIIEKEKDYIFIVLHFPIIKNGLIMPSEIDFFMGHGYLVTLHNGNLPPLNDFFNLCRKDEDSTLAYELESSSILLYEILEHLMNYCYQILDEHSKRITIVQDIVFKVDSDQRETAQELLTLRYNIIKIRRILQNHKNILQNLTTMKSSLVPASELKKYYSTLVDLSKRIWENLDNQKEMIEILHDTNESLLNNQINQIMKTLTIFSVIILPLNLIAAIFGMNTMVGMPFINNPHGFWYVIIIMLLPTAFMLFYFKRKHWL